MEDASVQELEVQLNDHKEKYFAIETALKQDYANETLLKLKSELWEVIQMLQDLVKLKKKALPVTGETEVANTSTATNAAPAITTAAEPTSPNGIKPVFKVGTKVLAKYTEDSLWYEATIDSIPITADDKYWITFLSYGNKQECSLEDLAPVNTQGLPRGIEIPSNTPEDETDQLLDAALDNKTIPIPKSLKILPTDSEDVRNMKKRKLHAIKSQNRIKKLEDERYQSAISWKEFNQKASKKSKTGFTSAKSKESIFKSPDNPMGRVGVTGSGKALTPLSTFNPKEVERVKKSIVKD